MLSYIDLHLMAQHCKRQKWYVGTGCYGNKCRAARIEPDKSYGKFSVHTKLPSPQTLQSVVQTRTSWETEYQKAELHHANNTTLY